jgi:hypothetical protein
MNPLYVTLGVTIWSTVVAVIGWRVCHRSGFSAQSQLRREHFYSFIELRLNKIRNGAVGVGAFFFDERQEDFAAFNKEVLDVRPHISKFQRSRFDEACAAYKNINPSVMEEKNAKAKEQAISCLGEILSYAK